MATPTPRRGKIHYRYWCKEEGNALVIEDGFQLLNNATYDKTNRVLTLDSEDKEAVIGDNSWRQTLYVTRANSTEDYPFDSAIVFDSTPADSVVNGGSGVAGSNTLKCDQAIGFHVSVNNNHVISRIGKMYNSTGSVSNSIFTIVPTEVSGYDSGILTLVEGN